MKFLEIARIVFALLPAIMNAVRDIEGAIPVAGKGADKLRAVLEIVEGIFAVSGQVGATFAECKPAIERAVSAVVGLANRTGLFKTSQPTATP